MPTTRALDPIPDSPFDADGSPRWGSYRGSFDRVDLDPVASRLDRLFRRKRWMWMTAVTDEVLVAACVVDLGYVANGFAFVATKDAIVVDRSAIVPRARVAVDGAARLESRGLKLTLETRSIRISAPGLDVDATIDATNSPPAITAIARAGKFNITQKRALATVRGQARAAGKTFALDGGLAGWDYTAGLLARHTAWKWAFGIGRDRSGTPIAFNLVDGFVGATECALFRPGETIGLEEPRITLTGVRGSDVDLEFRSVGAHEQNSNFGIVRSRFVQAAGTFHGTIHGIAIDGVRGVAEDQDVLW